MVATEELDELQCELNVTSCVVASLNVPVAINCCVAPVDTEGLSGLTAMLTSVPVPTVNVVVPVIPNAVAEMVTLPAFFPCTIPDERTFANCGFDDFHVTLVKVAVLPSVYVPVAVNLSKVPLLIVGFAGVMLIEANATLETLSVVD